MRTYSYVKELINGKEAETIDIYREHNVFLAYLNDENIYSGSRSGLMEVIEGWKKAEIMRAEAFRNLGYKFDVEFRQTIA